MSTDCGWSRKCVSGCGRREKYFSDAENVNHCRTTSRRVRDLQSSILCRMWLHICQVQTNHWESEPSTGKANIAKNRTESVFQSSCHNQSARPTRPKGEPYLIQVFEFGLVWTFIGAFEPTKRDWARSSRRRATELDVPTCPPTKTHQNIKMKIKIKKQYKTPKRTAVGEASFPAPLKRSTIDQIYIYSYQNSFYYMNKG
jgi:hypothetical protein